MNLNVMKCDNYPIFGSFALGYLDYYSKRYREAISDFLRKCGHNKTYVSNFCKEVHSLQLQEISDVKQFLGKKCNVKLKSKEIICMLTILESELIDYLNLK